MFYKEGFIIVNLKIKFILDFAPHYVWVLDKKCYNKKTGRFIKQTRCGGSIGYYIDGDFISCTALKPHLIKQK
jgi:hypothetical protein